MWTALLACVLLGVRRLWRWPEPRQGSPDRSATDQGGCGIDERLGAADADDTAFRRRMWRSLTPVMQLTFRQKDGAVRLARCPRIRISCMVHSTRWAALHPSESASSSSRTTQPRRWRRCSIASRPSSFRRSPTCSSATTQARTRRSSSVSATSKSPSCRSRSFGDRATSATAATRRPRTAGRSSTSSTSSCCCTATASTRPSTCRRWCKPLLDGECDAVFGSRMMDKGRRGAAVCRSTSSSGTGS